MNAVTSALNDDDSAPTSEDSVTVCINCASILFFTPDLKLRMPTLDEIVALKKQGDDVYDTLLRMQRFVRQLDRRDLTAQNAATTTGSQKRLRRAQDGKS